MSADTQGAYTTFRTIVSRLRERRAGSGRAATGQTPEGKAITSGNDQGVPRGPERPYEVVAADLRRRIAAGEWQPGEALVRVVPRWGTFRA
jgi:hypothetical protein